MQDEGYHAYRELGDDRTKPPDRIRDPKTNEPISEPVLLNGAGLRMAVDPATNPIPFVIRYRHYPLKDFSALNITLP